MENENKYKDYSAKDLLKDNAFLLWLMEPDEKTNLFWNNLQRLYPNLRESIQVATTIFHSIQINQPGLDEAEKSEILSAVYTRYKRNRFKKIIYSCTAAAACILLILGMHFFTEKQAKHIPQNDIEALLSSPSQANFKKLKDIEVVIGNTKKIKVEENANININGNSVHISGQESNSQISSAIGQGVKFSSLIVPYGKRSFLTLPDGTKVWVNSGTEVRFPNEMKGRERHIFVDGEIYIEVVHDSKRPFFVHTSSLNVQVYGTKFNVNSYHSDLERSVVLVEGRVSVKDNKAIRPVMLSNNQRYVQGPKGHSVENVNSSEYISWTKGMWIFTKERLSSVALRLTRYYGKEIHCDQSIASKTCTGKLILFDDEEKTIATLSDIFSVTYQNTNSRINISNKP
jgi:transmembrane sensor